MAQTQKIYSNLRWGKSIPRGTIRHGCQERRGRWDAAPCTIEHVLDTLASTHPSQHSIAIGRSSPANACPVLERSHRGADRSSSTERCSSRKHFCSANTPEHGRAGARADERVTGSLARATRTAVAAHASSGSRRRAARNDSRHGSGKTGARERGACLQHAFVPRFPRFTFLARRFPSQPEVAVLPVNENANPPAVVILRVE